MHGVQLSLAPVLNVFAEHCSTPDLSALTFVPAEFVEQYALPAAEYSPAPSQSSQPESSEAPLALNVPTGHGA